MAAPAHGSSGSAVAAWWATLVVGLAVLLLGRRLFWLFVGATGFAVGLHVGRVAWSGQPEWVGLAAALALGVAGALVALLAQWVAVGVGGCLGGAAVALVVAETWRLGGPWRWAWVLGAGVAGALLLLWLWDAVLVGLSAVLGALLVTSLVPLSGVPAVLLFVGLVIGGVLVQGRVGPPEGRARPARARRRG